MDTFLKSLPQSSEDWGRNEHPCNCWLQCWGKKRRGSVFCEFQIILHPFFILYSSEYHLHQLSDLWVSNHPFIIPISFFIPLSTIFINSSVFCEFVLILFIFLHIGHIQHPHHDQCSSHVVSSSYWVPQSSKWSNGQSDLHWRFSNFQIAATITMMMIGPRLAITFKNLLIKTITILIEILMSSSPSRSLPWSQVQRNYHPPQ